MSGKLSLAKAKRLSIGFRRYGIEFDEIHFGKPHAHIYIDDNAVPFRSWDLIVGDGSSLPSNHEELFRQGIDEQGRNYR